MTKEDYLLHLRGTLDTYSTKLKKHLKTIFIENKIAIENEDNQPSLFGEINISDLDSMEQLLICLKNSEKAITEFENWEYRKAYKYSVPFQSLQFENLIEKIVSLSTKTSENEALSLSNNFDKPLIKTIENRLFIKFNLKFSAVDPLSQEETLLKYPFLIVIHKNEKIIEFRFDTLKDPYTSKNKDIYSSFIKEGLKYFKEVLAIELHPLDLISILDHAKKQEDVKVMAQYMKLASGGNAQLEVGKNESCVLPILGELKALITDHAHDLEKLPNLKSAFEQFIFEKEEMSEYPWIELLWENEIKTRSIQIKIIFNYQENNYCLIQHYYNSVLIEMERMNHVIEYISKHKTDANQ